MEPKDKNEETPTTHQVMDGYDYEFVPDPEPRYECPICLLVLRDPCQTKCGHLFCRDCILHSIRVSSNRCPVDNKPLEETDVYPDNFAKREILNMNLKCPNNKQGCDSILQLSQTEKHLEECHFGPVLCPNNCSCDLLRKDIESHLSSSCEERMLTCQHCDHDTLAKAMENHVVVCPKVIMACPHCDEKKPRWEIEQHIQTECQNVKVHCPFYLLGCSESLVRSSIDQHIMCAGPCHMKQLCHAVSLVTIKLGITDLTSQTTLDNLQEHLRLVQDFNSVIGSQDSALSQEGSVNIASDGASVCSVSISDHSHTHSVCQNSSSRGEVNLAVGCGAQKMTSNSVLGKQRITHAHKVGDQKQKAICHTDLEKMIQEISSKFENRLAAMQQRFEELHNRLTVVEQESSSLVNSVEGLEQNFADTSARCYDGNFFWCVSNFSQYRIKLEAGQNSVLHSPSFYTSPFGYRLCVRASVEMSSDNKMQLSLFIHFMKSRNDAFLKWPFSGKITISVIDQNQDPSQRKHMEETLEANPALLAFQKPTTLRNHKGFGYINFLSIATLENGTFLLNDTLVIRTQVFPSSE